MSIDHLVVGFSDLAQGVSFVERITGVRPAIGWSSYPPGNPQRDPITRTRCYLEILAPDSTQGRLVRVLAALAGLDEPRLVKWADGEVLSLLFEPLDAGVRLRLGPHTMIRAALDTPRGEVNLMS